MSARHPHPRDDRLALGQWFTPAPVADLALSLALVGEPCGARVLDPTCGHGVFLARAVARGVPAPDGVELDPELAAAAAARVPGAQVRAGDVFALARDAAGYDAVVGNPPYVRQERLGAERKRAIREVLAADWPALPARELRALTGRGDLAVAVIARALRLVRPGGRLAFVVSSALIDAAYARPLWRLIAAEGGVRAVIDAPDERWFGDAAINPVIVVIERSRAARPVALARLRVPTARAAGAVRALADLATVAAVESGGPDPASWRSALRAPAAWFELVDAAGDALVPLGELAELRRGTTSGANDIFYLRRERASALGLEPAVLRPLVRAPGATIGVDGARLDEVALVVPPDAELSALPATRAYLEAHAGAVTRPTLRARAPWWALPVAPARAFLTKAYSERFVQQLAAEPSAADQRVYALFPRLGLRAELLAATLNSTYTALALESLGRASMGEGALEWTVADARRLLVPDPRRMQPDAVGVLAALADRAIGPVRDEVGRHDRRALDRSVAPTLEPVRERVAAALIDAVAERVGRATARAVTGS
jgi:SAM-dependent methyltransferase